MAVPKSLKRKKSKEKEQTLAELNSALPHLQANFQLVQTNYIERIKLFLFAPYNKVIGYPSGQDGAILPARDYALCPARKISLKPAQQNFVS